MVKKWSYDTCWKPRENLVFNYWHVYSITETQSNKNFYPNVNNCIMHCIINQCHLLEATSKSSILEWLNCSKWSYDIYTSQTTPK